MSLSRASLVVLALLLAIPAAHASAADAPPSRPEVLKKLHDLAYPTDPELAVDRWRIDNRRTDKGPLTDAETAAILAQPLPESIAAMTGNPFTGLGLALSHTTRAEAEREAIRLCKANGGGSTCTSPLTVRADQCVAVVGYAVTIDRRPTYRTSIAVSTRMETSLNAAKSGCPLGASHPGLCRPLLTFCGDGRELKVYDGKDGGEAQSSGH